VNKLIFQSLASGSAGNCYFLGTKDYGILVDAGIGARSINKRLKNSGIELSQIYGIIVTHDHGDHIKGLGTLGERFKIPVFATQDVHQGITRNLCTHRKLTESNKRFIEKNKTFQLGEFAVTAFPVSHDASDNMGYTVEYQDKKFVFATDLGYIGSEATEHIAQADYLVIEANYDEDMLTNGSYPQYLKNRIKSNTGHLSNRQTAEFLAENYDKQMKYIFLCHLSGENNLPEIAYLTVRKALAQRGINAGEDVELVTLDRYAPSRVYEF
jgi:phosphoribosyl 1,2-cyclic phosphodiesterase